MNLKLILIALSTGMVVSFSSYLASEEVLEEVIVTAQKKEQAIMDVAAAISSYSGSDLQNKRIDNIEGIQLLVPDMVVTGESKLRTNIRIRGIGSYQFHVGSDPSVSLVVDGVLQPHVATNTHSFSDIERIEVLKGPQGALYGANSLGGVVSIVTRKPGPEGGSRITLSGGENGYQYIDYRGDMAVGDNVSVRLNISQGSDDGTATNTITETNDGVDLENFRLSFYGETENTEWSAVMGQSKLSTDTIVSEPVFLCNSQNPQAHWFALFVTPLTNVCSSLAPPTSYNVAGTPNTSNALYQQASADRNTSALNIDGFQKAENKHFSFSTRTDFDSYTMTALFSAIKTESSELRDFDGMPVDIMEQSHEADMDAKSFEIRWDSNNTGNVSWSFGLYGLRDEGFRHDLFDLGPASVFNVIQFANASISTGILPINPANAAAVIAAYQGCIGTCPAFLIPGLPRGNTVTAVDVQNLITALTASLENHFSIDVETKTYAAFGNVTIALNDKTNLSLGGRYTSLDKPYTFTGATNAVGVPLTVAPFSASVDKLDATEFDPKITLDYSIDENTMIWSTYSTGFKAGGPNYAQWDAASASSPYAAEELKMIEFGYKSTLNEGRSQLEAIAYTYDYKNHQQILVCSGPTGPYGCVLNGDVTIKGLDFNYRTLIGDFTQIGFAYSYLDSKWERFIDLSAGGRDRSGEKMPFAADNSISLDISHLQNTSMGDVTYSAILNYKDEYSLNLNHWAASGGLLEDLLKINASVTLDINEDTSVALFCKNCTDEEHTSVSLMVARAQGGGARSSYAEGRVSGIEFTKHF